MSGSTGASSRDHESGGDADVPAPSPSLRVKTGHPLAIETSARLPSLATSALPVNLSSPLLREGRATRAATRHRAGVVTVAQEPHMDVTAEGIETGQQRHELKALGCDLGRASSSAGPRPRAPEAVLAISMTAPSSALSLPARRGPSGPWPHLHPPSVSPARSVFPLVRVGVRRVFHRRSARRTDALVAMVSPMNRPRSRRPARSPWSTAAKRLGRPGAKSSPYTEAVDLARRSVAWPRATSMVARRRDGAEADTHEGHHHGAGWPVRALRRESPGSGGARVSHRQRLCRCRLVRRREASDEMPTRCRGETREPPWRPARVEELVLVRFTGDSLDP